MKGINKKGFTLIELLAVIVVLAIVMVLAATTVLPYMADARKEAFALEANTLKDSAVQAIRLITIGAESGYDEDVPTGYDYCFTLTDLRDELGLFQKDDITDYAGRVVVKKEGNLYTYTVNMKNKDFFVKDVSTNVSKNNVDEIANVGTTSFTCAS